MILFILIFFRLQTETQNVSVKLSDESLWHTFTNEEEEEPDMEAFRVV